MRRAIALFVAVTPIAFALGPQQASKTVSYARDVAPILKKRCLSCHAGAKPKGALDLSSPDGMLKGGLNKPLFVAGSSKASRLCDRIRGIDGSRMPLGVPALPKSEIDTILAWVDQGAKFDGQTVKFEAVQSIFKVACVSCHGGESPSANLDLSTVAGLMKGGISGKVVAPGQPEKSLLIKRTDPKGAAPVMPMGFEPLSKVQRDLLAQWIREGASKKLSAPVRHWAYVAPKRPAVPAFRKGEWAINPIDAFILDRLHREGIVPAPAADRATLIRRASLDLTGLPPTPDEVDKFLADKRPDAYERLVDRLLASPAYGERQARFWLDLARYADSNGYEADRMRTMWPYRDWVIQAFNRNMPFDQFTIEQLAGDLLPHPTQDQLVATGFQRNAMFNEEGGVDAGEQLFYVLLDRVATTGTVWMGATIGCARCHDHKYDPFSQQDHYAMLAFYNATDAQLQGDFNVGQARYIEPTLTVTTPEIEAKLKSASAKLELAKSKTALDDAGRRALDDFEKMGRSYPAPTPAIPDRFVAEGGAIIAIEDKGSIKVFGANPAKDAYEITFQAPRGATAIVLEAQSDSKLVNKGFGRSDSGNIVLTKFALSSANAPLPIADFRADFIQSGYDVSRLESGSDASGWALAPKYGASHRLVAQLAEPLTEPKTLTLRLEFHSPWPQHGLGAFRVLVSQAPLPALNVAPESITSALASEPKSDAQRAQLATYFQANWIGNWAARRDVAKLEAELATLRSELPTMLVMRDRAGAKTEAPLYKRGDYHTPGAAVCADMPAALPPMAPNAPRNRLGLAQYLVDPKNPLTARVEANRIWEQYFGRGIVETLEDFGTQGSRPTHPELLDWLAVELMESHWDLKRLHKLIVTSATYRRASTPSASAITKDPTNRWLASMPRVRLDAEAVRDNALAASGLLSRKVGGPSVFPYQPEGVWDTPYSGESWTESSGDDRYRRGIYVFWKRTASYPSFMALDATSRESCTPRRIRTNTPLQALALLNDPVYLEAAKALATASIRDAKPSGPTAFAPQKSIEVAFRRALARRPSAAELQRLMRTYQSAQREASKNYPADQADRHALELVCNVILNLDETITRP